MKFKKFIQHIQKHIPNVFKNKKEKLLTKINSNFFYPTYIPLEYTDDEDIVLAVVNKNGLLLNCASNRLKDNEKIVLTAINQHGAALQFSSDRLRDDKSFTLKVAKNFFWTLEYVSERLKNDKELLEFLENTDFSYWRSIEKEWYEEKMEVLTNIRKREDKELMESAITTSKIKNKKLKF